MVTAVAQPYVKYLPASTLVSLSGISSTVTVGSDIRVPLVNSPELQLRFLNPNDVPEVKTLCAQWFPIEYPDSWWVTKNQDFGSTKTVW